MKLKLYDQEIIAHEWQLYYPHPEYIEIEPLEDQHDIETDGDTCPYCFRSYSEHGYDTLSTEIVCPATMIIDMGQVFPRLLKVPIYDRSRLYFIHRSHLINSDDNIEIIEDYISPVFMFKYISRAEAMWVDREGGAYLTDMHGHINIATDIIESLGISSSIGTVSAYRRLEEMGFVKIENIAGCLHIYNDRPLSRKQFKLISKLLYSKIGLKVNFNYNNYISIIYHSLNEKDILNILNEIELIDEQFISLRVS